ncbi:hypothetical protein ACFSUD_18810 [Sulfitobacter aestuarii]|uniref:Uncharacterized protein n=1 Tax=Sulfitobacter aestuarii TaxID=2161676 RepID=A0ABW5U6R6_9RHOB
MSEPKEENLMRFNRRPPGQRLIGWVASAIFAVFVANILIAKLTMLGAFTLPRLSPVLEFALLIASTLFGVLFLLKEERRCASGAAELNDER